MQEHGINECGSPLAYFYFISFMILLSMIVMNLSVAAVIDGLNSARNDFFCCVKSDDISILLDLWKEYDPKGKGWISFE